MTTRTDPRRRSWTSGLPLLCLVVLSLCLAGCGGGSGGDAGSTRWDELRWDEGRWD